MKTNILYAGPFDTYGVFKGGICGVVNSLYDYYLDNKPSEYEVFKFNTCTIKRSKTAQGKFNFENIKNTVNIYKNIIREIREKRIDCVYYNSSNGLPLIKDLLILNKVKKKTKVKVVVHIHFADFEKVLPKLVKMGMRLLNNLDFVVFLSKNTREEFIIKGLTTESFVIYNFHDFHMPCNKTFNEELRLLFVGSLCHRKGIIDLLKALQKVNRPFVLNVCGEYIEEGIKDEVEELVKQLPNNSVIFNGFVSGNQKTQIFASSNIFVLPSYGEGLPLVILEAMAAGCCIFTTNVGANTEILETENGQIFEPGDINKLSCLLNNVEHDYLINVSKENIKKSQNYTLEKFFENTLSVIERVIKSND